MKYIASFFLLLILQFGCTSKASTISESIQTIHIERFDSVFYHYLKNPNTEYKNKLQHDYLPLLSALGSVTINKSDVKDKQFFPLIESYFSNDALQNIYRDAMKTFSDTHQYEEELSKANGLISEKYQGKHLPKLAMHISGFKENTLVLENQISISIDKYLGADYPMYRQFFEGYQRSQMQPKMITRDYLKAWIISEIPIVALPVKSLLQEMIHEGKVMNILSQFLPEWERTDLIGYTSEQMNWCTSNETNIWKSIIQQKHLYNDEYFLNQKYIEEAPYTTPISQQSPGKLGVWVGWQIVDMYARNTGASIEQIMKADAQKILQDSKYNPSI